MTKILYILLTVVFMSVVRAEDTDNSYRDIPAFLLTRTEVEPSGWFSFFRNSTVIPASSAVFIKDYRMSAEHGLQYQVADEDGGEPMAWVNADNLDIIMPENCNTAADLFNRLRPGSYTNKVLDNFSQAADVMDIVKYLFKADGLDAPALTESFFEQGADCTGFIEDSDGDGVGSIGPLGKVVIQEILEDGVADINSNDFFQLPKGFFGDACPKFHKMSLDRKLTFWVWTVAALAHDESTCVANRTAQGVNDVADGLLQMPRSWSSRVIGGKKILGREDLGPGCNSNESVKVYNLYGNLGGVSYMGSGEKNLRCGVQVMGKILCGAYEGRGDVTTCDRENSPKTFFGSNSYWQKIRNQDKDVFEKMQEFPGCKN